jgi:hypothetical protein
VLSTAARTELTVFRAAVLDPASAVRTPLHDAYRALAPADRTSALGDVALRLHATPGSEGASFVVREADGPTFEQLFDARSVRALGRWLRDRRLDDLVEAGEMWIRARAAD